jgi:3-oxoacyl-[acyl-carrier-protein] synthase II
LKDPAEKDPKAHTVEVVVTAAGIVSPLGNGFAETLASLREGRDCVAPVTDFDVSRTRSSTAGQVAPFDLAPCRIAPGRLSRLHKASRMMIAAIQELFAGDPAYRPELAVIGTTSGAMTFGESYFRALYAKSGRALKERANWLANYLPQKPVSDALEAADLPVPSQIIANACASGTNAIGHAFSLIRAGRHRRVLCGGYDAISEMVFVGFDSLQAATPERIRPFDRDRSGLVLGEGAALLALEALDAAVERGAPILAKVTGYGISTDNYHLTQPHPSGEGPYLAMRRALEDAGRESSEIDYINAHGTATTFNDATEGAAIARLFEGHRVPVSSTKSMMGHSLGAAGAIEAVFSLLALRNGFIPPNINFNACDPQWDLEIVANGSRDASLKCVLSNSFGFGGTNAAVVLEGAE